MSCRNGPDGNRSQADRKGRLYSIRCLCKPHDRLVESRATPIGVNLSPREREAGHPPEVALRETRLHRRHERRVSSRATPRSVNLSPREREAGHPQGVALLYAAAPQALRYVRL